MIWTIKRDTYFGLHSEMSIPPFITVVRLKRSGKSWYHCTFDNLGLKHSHSTDSWKDVEQFIKGYTNEDQLSESGA